MKYTWRVAEIPDGDTVIPNQSIAVRKISDGASITTIHTDDDGFVTLQADGHYEPFYLHLQGVPGGDKFWLSDESHAVGANSPMELPVAMRVAGDGVVRGYTGELAVSLSGGGPSVIVADGAAVVAGHPFVQYTDFTLIGISRPVTSTRIDRIIIRLYPVGSATTPGKADIAILAGVEGAAATALTQSATVYEVGLYTLTVPTSGTTTLTDERPFANETGPVTGETRSAQETTTSAVGAALTNLNTSLVLPRTATYDVEAWVSGVQENGGGWALQATYGSLGAGTSPNFNTPGQVATDSSGNVYVADTVNSRLVKLNSSGAYVSSITGLTSITGVCLDGSDNIYVVYNTNRTRSYQSDMATVRFSTSGGGTLKHICTDNTTYYFTDNSLNRIWSMACSGAGSPALLVSAAGSGNGQLSGPYGICYSASEIYVVDAGNSRVQVFNTSGAYQRQWAIAAGCRGIAPDASGDVLVAGYSGNTVYHTTNAGVAIDSFSQDTPGGIGVASGDVLWVSNVGTHNVAKWDEAAAGYGGMAVEINGNLGTYITLGDVSSMLQNSHTTTATGPATITVKAYAKATSGTATYRSIVLSAKAVPRS